MAKNFTVIMADVIKQLEPYSKAQKNLILKMISESLEHDLEQTSSLITENTDSEKHKISDSINEALGTNSQINSNNPMSRIELSFLQFLDFKVPSNQIRCLVLARVLEKRSGRDGIAVFKEDIVRLIEEVESYKTIKSVTLCVENASAYLSRGRDNNHRYYEPSNQPRSNKFIISQKGREISDKYINSFINE
jgi:hypothetical protein